MEIVLNIFSKILEMSLQATIAIFLIVIVREIFKLMRLPKKISYLLWIIPFIRLAVPFSLESSLSVMPVSLNIYEKTATADSQQISGDTDDTYTESDDIYHHSFLEEDSQPVTDDNKDAIVNSKYDTDEDLHARKDNTKKSNDTPGLWNMLSMIWICGVIGIGLYSIVSLVVFRRKLNTRVAVAENIFQCDYIDTAFVLGIISPKIYIPSRICKEEMEYVIAHENSHIRRLDHIIKPVAFLVVAIHWFNPFAWLGYALMEKDMEMACDEAVLSQVGLDKKSDYAEALLNLSTKKHYALSIPTAFGEGDTKGRVKNVMKLKKPVILFVVIAVIAVVILGVILLTNPKKDEASAGVDEENNIILPGTYVMEVDGTKDAFIPKLTVEKDKSFSFGYDPFSSYLAISFNEYEISGDKVIFTTNDGLYKYTFKIVDEKTLEFIKNRSSSVELVDEGVAYKIEDGSRFVLSDTENDITSTVVGEYPAAEVINVGPPDLTKENGLGNGGAILDYADDKYIIFHGKYGLFVYDRTKECITDAFGLYGIECHYTSGDSACLVEVADDRIYLTPGNQDKAYIYDIGDNVLISVGRNDIQNIKKERASLVLEDYVMLDHTSFMSYNCVSVEENGETYYGYLLSGTGLWYDLQYVEDRGGSHKTISLLSDYME